MLAVTSSLVVTGKHGASKVFRGIYRQTTAQGQRASWRDDDRHLSTRLFLMPATGVFTARYELGLQTKAD